MAASLEGSLVELMRDPVGRELLADMNVGALGVRMATDDRYGDGPRMQRAAALTGADVADWYSHRLWCARREALAERAKPLSMKVIGADYLDETAGWPTMVVAPMTLAVADALSVIGRLANGRDVIVYGHEVFADDVLEACIDVADPNGQTRSHIESILDGGGVYCTYGDFAYAGLAARAVTLFGRRRPMSSGWVRLAAREGTMLLPVLCRQTSEDHVAVELGEPVRIESTTPLANPDGVAKLLAELLEEQIRVAPSQWLLLPTLSFESPEMARTDGAGSRESPSRDMTITAAAGE